MLIFSRWSRFLCPEQVYLTFSEYFCRVFTSRKPFCFLPLIFSFLYFSFKNKDIKSFSFFFLSFYISLKLYRIDCVMFFSIFWSKCGFYDFLLHGFVKIIVMFFEKIIYINLRKYVSVLNLRIKLFE